MSKQLQLNPTVYARAKKAKFNTDNFYNCLACGKPFKSDACPHSVTDNVNLAQAAQAFHRMLPMLKKHSS